ncbi:hypothetical protein, partial [Actinomadura sp. 7K507]|uniref:hypothetical protein n=1 Tax=Actinomadura sp. 7K507 TaxID=2530365 RepID=UPI0010EE82BE
MTKGGGEAGGQAGGRGRPSQGSAGNRTGGNQSPADQRKAKAQGWGCLTVIVALVAGGIVWGLYDEGVFDKKPAKDAPVFGPQQTGRLVEQLSTAADAQGVCYGWVIDSGRPHKIKQLAPSYPGTFRPHPPKQAPGQVAPSEAV